MKQQRMASLLILAWVMAVTSPLTSAFAPGAMPGASLCASPGKLCLLPRTPALGVSAAGAASARGARGAAGVAGARMVESIEELISGASEGSTVVLKKGTYEVRDSLVIDKDLTIVGEQGVPREGVIIKAQAPYEVRHCLASIRAKVCIKGVSFDYPGGSYDVGLGQGKEAICLRVEGTAHRNKTREAGRLEIEDCVITTGAGAAIVALGGSATVLVNTCRIGPVGWEESGLSGYGVAMMMGARGEVINTDIYRTGTSGVLAYGENTRAKVVMCDIGPCVLSCLAAEGARTQIKAKKVKLRDAAWRQIAELNGGECEIEMVEIVD